MADHRCLRRGRPGCHTRAHHLHRGSLDAATDLHAGHHRRLGLVIGLYKGALFGGSISAISFATPGAPDSAATVFDGYRMTQKGQGRKALLTSLYSSVTADTLSDVLVILIAPMMALAALQFGPAERTWLMVVAIALLGALSGKHVAKGLLAAAIGLYIGTIGTDPIGGASRNTFGLAWLRDGISLVPLIIGLFAMSRMLEQGVELLHESRLGTRSNARCTTCSAASRMG
ncbi:hypothetical protein Q427_17295 [Halomonas sp. BC04]|nr:hypothetical protein Q427_17295 [Halomonas sp. BC04]